MSVDIPGLPPLAALPYTDDPRPWRRVAAAMLLRACLDAEAGNLPAAFWLISDQARAWAAEVDLDAHWPPTWSQILELAARHRGGR